LKKEDLDYEKKLDDWLAKMIKKKNEKNFKIDGWKLLVAIPALVGVIALETWITQLLWNWLMPIIFGLPKVTFWQALGLQLLTTVLFTSIRLKK